MKAYYEELWERLPADLDPPSCEARRRFLRSEVRVGDRVLDLGCGEGAFLPVAREAVGDLDGRGGRPGPGRVVGAEVASAALRRAAAAAGRADADLVLVPFDGPLPFGDGEFDVVWASEVIEHVADTGAWLSEIRRVLAPGGRLLVTTPSAGRARLVLLGVERLAPPLGDHLHLYTAGGLRRVLAEDFGFGSVRVRACGGVPGARRMLMARGTR